MQELLIFLEQFGYTTRQSVADNGGDWPTSYHHDIWGVSGITEEMSQEAKTFRFDLVAE